MQTRQAKIDHGNAFDWGKTSAQYAQFRDIYPPVFYEQLLARFPEQQGNGCCGNTASRYTAGTQLTGKAVAAKAGYNCSKSNNHKQNAGTGHGHANIRVDGWPCSAQQGVWQP